MSQAVEAVAAPVCDDRRIATAVQERRAQLVLELQHGRTELEALDARRAELRAAMLRIAGAVQVLDEVLGTLED